MHAVAAATCKRKQNGVAVHVVSVHSTKTVVQATEVVSIQNRHLLICCFVILIRCAWDPSTRPPHRQSETISSSAVCKSLRDTDSTQNLVPFCGHLCARRLARHKRSDCFGVPAGRSTQFAVLSSVCAVLLFGLQVSRPSSKRPNLASWSMFKIVRTKRYVDSMYAQCVFPLCVCISVGCIVL